MTYRARHVRAVPPVSSQVRCRKFRVGRAGQVRRADRDVAAKRGHVAVGAEFSEDRANGPRSTAAASLLSRLDRVGTPLLVVGAIAFVLAFERFVMRVAEPSYVHRMFDLGMFRDGGLIVRHAYHVHSGQPTGLYGLVPHYGANPFSYPPFAAAVFAVMSFLSPLALEWGITVLSVGALTYAVWLTLDGLGMPRGRARTGVMLAASAAALWTQPVQSNLSLGQINLLLMAAIIWDLRPSRAGLNGIRVGSDGPIVGSAFSTVGSPWWTGLATGVAAGVKLTPLIFIPYLLITRRFRQAAVAAAAFAVTVGIGFAVVPEASARYWQSGLLDRATGAPSATARFFFGSTWNQSLRGYLSRLLHDSQIAVAPWLIAAALTLVIGLVCATWLHRDGYPMLGLLTCAVTGLLISPVSWVHQWVWIGPWLAALGGLALLARGASRRIWLAVTGLLILAFGNFPVTAGLTGGRHGMNVITDVPMNQPATWHGHQVIAGNIYFLCGAAGLMALFCWGIVRAFRQEPDAQIEQPLPLPAMPANVELVPEAMTLRE
jgi:alpha-1,2-mannosyltransferase